MAKKINPKDGKDFIDLRQARTMYSAAIWSAIVSPIFSALLLVILLFLGKPVPAAAWGMPATLSAALAGIAWGLRRE